MRAGVIGVRTERGRPGRGLAAHDQRAPPTHGDTTGKLMIEEHLARAVISAIMLLDHSTAEEIDRDVASQGLENIASDLSAMNEMERQEFRRVLGRIAEDDPEHAPYLEELPHLLGWNV
jgi:hypothetical protein